MILESIIQKPVWLFEIVWKLKLVTLTSSQLNTPSVLDIVNRSLQL